MAPRGTARRGRDHVEEPSTTSEPRMRVAVSGFIWIGVIALASIFGTAASAAPLRLHTPAAERRQGMSLGAGGRERSPLADAPRLLAPSSLGIMPGGELGFVPGGRVRPLATTPVISTTPSTTKPYWACPHEACEA